MELSALNVIELLAGFQAFLFSIYLFFKKEGKKISNYFIAIYILLLAYNILDFMSAYLFDRWSDDIMTFLQLLIYLAAPVLFLHIKTSLFSRFSFRPKILLHTIPFLLTIGFIIILKVNEFKSGALSSDSEKIIGIIMYGILYVQTFIYLFYSYREVKRHKEIFFENYSTSNIQRYAYLTNLILFVGVLFLLSVFNIVTKFVYQLDQFSFVSYIVIITVLFLFCWLIIIGLRSPELFIDERKAQPSVKKLVKQNVNNTLLKSDEEKNALIARLNTFMSEEEPFLDPSLTLHSLAQETGISSRELSILINHNLNKHFFGFVNEYRIEKAMESLSNPAKNDRTVLEILYEVGFNSKSSFNTAFKKYVGLTPTEYRRKKALTVA